METLYLGAAPVKFEWLVNVVHAAVTLWLSSFYELVKRKLFGDRNDSRLTDGFVLLFQEREYVPSLRGNGQYGFNRTSNFWKRVSYMILWGYRSPSFATRFSYNFLNALTATRISYIIYVYIILLKYAWYTATFNFCKIFYRICALLLWNSSYSNHATKI